MIHSHSRAGYSFKNNAGLTDSVQVFPVTKDVTNSAQSASFPNSCNIQSIEISLTSVSAGSMSVTAYLARDSGGLNPVTPGATSGATQDITYTSGTTKGGVIFAINSDYHYDSSVTNVTEGTIYCIAYVSGSSQTATADIRVNWRA